MKPKELVNSKKWKVGQKVRIGMSIAKIIKLRKYKLEIEIISSENTCFIGCMYEVVPSSIREL